MGGIYASPADRARNRVETGAAPSRRAPPGTVESMFRTIMERIRHRRKIRRIARSHHHGGQGATTTAMDTDSAAKARGAGETIGRQGGYGGG